MACLVCIFIFLFGLCMGSFLNVLIYRLPREIDFLKGRSFCPECKKKLAWWELVPLFSYIFLRGKCRKCRVKISLKYPIVEFLTGTLFLLFFLKITTNGLWPTIYELEFIVYGWIILSVLITIFFIDLRHYIIPDSLMIIGALATLIYLGLACFGGGQIAPTMQLSKNILPYFYFTMHNSLFINNIIFAIMGGVFFGLIILLTRGRGMGIGDMKFGILMGLILGGKLIAALYLAFVGGAVVGMGLILLKNKTLKSKVPFGPFLVVATLILMFL